MNFKKGDTVKSNPTKFIEKIGIVTRVGRTEATKDFIWVLWCVRNGKVMEEPKEHIEGIKSLKIIPD